MFKILEAIWAVKVIYLFTCPFWNKERSIYNLMSAI